MRVSLLESFRRVVATEYGDEESLVRAIQGSQDPPTTPMRAGTALHAVLANPDKYKGEKYFQADGFSFERFDVARMLDHVGRSGITEWHGHWDAGGLTVTGTCDWIAGPVIQDHKTKFSALDSRDYEPSLQWRFYLQIFNADCLRYNFFEMGADLQLRNISSVKFWRYPHLAADCRHWIARFLAWAGDRGLLTHLEKCNGP